MPIVDSARNDITDFIQSKNMTFDKRISGILNLFSLMYEIVGVLFTLTQTKY